MERIGSLVFLSDQKMLIQADLFNSSEPSEGEASDANQSLYNHVQRLGLDVETIVPIHGEPRTWEDFVNILN